MRHQHATCRYESGPMGNRFLLEWQTDVRWGILQGIKIGTWCLYLGRQIPPRSFFFLNRLQTVLSLTFFLAHCSSISLFSLLPNCILIHGSICQILTSSCSILCFYQPGRKASPTAYVLAWCLASALIKAVGPLMWYPWPFGFGLALFQLPHGSVLLSVFGKTWHLPVVRQVTVPFWHEHFCENPIFEMPLQITRKSW